VDFPAFTICSSGTNEDMFHAALLRQSFKFFEDNNIFVGITPLDATIALYRKVSNFHFANSKFT
jgi:hypothetical protein